MYANLSVDELTAFSEQLAILSNFRQASNLCEIFGANSKKFQMLQAQEKAAKEQMDARAKEFKKQQKEALSKGLGGKGGSEWLLCYCNARKLVVELSMRLCVP